MKKVTPHIKRLLNVIVILSIMAAVGTLVVGIYETFSWRGSFDDDYLAGMAACLFPVMLVVATNYILGFGIKVFNRGV
ncbi:hypothetical protein [Vibrio mediterranei]|uniref:hypothetical protein n=1 Tax=Vibrio mediterranei TaxID=689 RepID=UPI0022842806|nr:hypothetical protein [Vibrio mediterranei]MCY9855900.1 hypothetical protein [Vibrio mediterranei]